MTYGSDRVCASVVASVLLAAPLAAQAPAPGFADALLGRWDLTVQHLTTEEGDGAYPSWLEVRLRTEGELMGRFVGRVGSVGHVPSTRAVRARHRRARVRRGVA
jgi:hypothetical protein